LPGRRPLAAAGLFIVVFKVVVMSKTVIPAKLILSWVMSHSINEVTKTILLADDDEDDRELFGDALQEISVSAKLHTAGNGIELMDILSGNDFVPDLLFLDLNMPRKNGHECLAEIKQHAHLRDVAVIIFSTSFQQSTVNNVYDQGASLYIVKPDNFTGLKNAIRQAIELYESGGLSHTKRDKEKFILRVS
jgi:CheY-like chemotaxis protein